MMSKVCVRSLLLLSIASIACGCAAEGADKVEAHEYADAPDTLAIVGGTVAMDNAAEVGFLRGPPGKCTATLVGTFTILTAAHCFNFGSHSDINTPTGYTWGRLNSDGSDSYRVNVLQYTSLGKSVGDDDVAVAQLQGTPARVKPARIWEVEPVAGFGATIYGYGCDAPTWSTRAHDFLCPPGSPAVLRYINIDRWSLNVETTDEVMGPIIAHGDSGGPMFAGGQIVGVSSHLHAKWKKGSGALVSSSGVFANVYRHQKEINRLIDLYGR